MIKNYYSGLLLTGIILLALSGCSDKLTEALRYGNVIHDESKETVDIEIHNKLIFLPVTLGGKKYRFLFDTGAPFSISNQLQQDNNFKIISKGNIVDSDHNRKNVNWVQVDTISIGNTLFTNQTAFIGDFEANPLLKCLEIDGIIGSNLLRHSNWTIDQEYKTLSLFSDIEDQDLEKHIVVPFRTDFQYDMFIDVNIGRASVQNVVVDYGSTGSLSLSDEIFGILKGKNIISEPFVERGINQSGIIGNPVALHREITYSDSVRINDQKLGNVMIRTGKTVSVGNDLLSRFKVTIDWNNKNLYLTKTANGRESDGLTGFRLGYTVEKGIYVQSVIENSHAYKKGIKSNMKVVKIDHLDFENGNDFCDYASHNPKNEIYLQIVDSLGQRQDFHFSKTLYVK